MLSTIKVFFYILRPCARLNKSFMEELFELLSYVASSFCWWLDGVYNKLLCFFCLVFLWNEKRGPRTTSRFSGNEQWDNDYQWWAYLLFFYMISRSGCYFANSDVYVCENPTTREFVAENISVSLVGYIKYPLNLFVHDSFQINELFSNN